MPLKPLTHAAFFTALLLALPGPGASQELGVMAGRGDSDFVELGSPSSLAVQLALPIAGRENVRVVGAYRFRMDTGERPGTICDRYWPEYTACAEEPIAHDTRLTQWEAGLAVGLPLTDRIEARASALRVRNTLEGSSEGAVTGRSAGSHYPDETVWSTAWVGGGAWRPSTKLPLALLAQLRLETLDFQGCATDVGTPFCAREPLTTLEVGIVVVR